MPGEQPVDRLAQLDFLERVQLQELARTRQWIADDRRRAQERARSRARRPVPPAYALELDQSGGPAVHMPRWGLPLDPQMARTRPMTADQARDALPWESVPPRAFYRPDSALGLTD
ncbi:hypothetical protein AB0C59_32215 [Streptomyces sp. NPDC048664]|uniref:hypothetical protein n=1 Tax=Streptomyces sp. NPDC048664 TaxID=3154505 RepID=UPI003415B781